MELVAEAQVDNEVKAAYQQFKLQEDGPSFPMSHSPLLCRIPMEFNPDIDIIISDDEHPWPNNIFCILPSLGHRPPKTTAENALSLLDNVAAKRPLKKPDPPPNPLDPTEKQKMDITSED